MSVLAFPNERRAAHGSEVFRQRVIDALKTLRDREGTATVETTLDEALISLAGILAHVAGRDRLRRTLAAIIEVHEL
jgi:hypothetical protein